MKANPHKWNPGKCVFPLSLVLNIKVSVNYPKTENKNSQNFHVTIDLKLNVDIYVSNISEKAGVKVSAMIKDFSLKLLNKEFSFGENYFSSQIGHCLLVWMSCNRTLNNSINILQKRALNLVDEDFNSSFINI